VFFDAERRGAKIAHADALRAQHELDQAGAGFNDAAGRGDHFPFLKNYVDRTFDYVGSHFGSEFAARLATLSPSPRWQGPFRSAYGEHIVLLTQRTERSYPKLEDVREQVEQDYLRERSSAALAKMVEAVRDHYRVEIADDVRSGDGP